MELIIDTGSSDLWVPSLEAKGFLSNGIISSLILVKRFDCN